MRRILIVMCVINSASAYGIDPGAIPAAATTAVAPAGDLKKWQGFWKADSIKYDGVDQLADAKQRAMLTLVVKDGEYRMYFASDAAEDKHVRLFTADLALDPAAKTFALTIREGQKKGEKRHGIYDLSGGKLTVCYCPADKPRPTKFEAGKGADTFVETWSPEKR